MKEPKSERGILARRREIEKIERERGFICTWAPLVKVRRVFREGFFPPKEVVHEYWMGADGRPPLLPMSKRRVLERVRLDE